MYLLDICCFPPSSLEGGGSLECCLPLVTLPLQRARSRRFLAEIPFLLPSGGDAAAPPTGENVGSARHTSAKCKLHVLLQLQNLLPGVSSRRGRGVLGRRDCPNQRKENALSTGRGVVLPHPPSVFYPWNSAFLLLRLTNTWSVSHWQPIRKFQLLSSDTTCLQKSYHSVVTEEFCIY